MSGTSATARTEQLQQALGKYLTARLDAPVTVRELGLVTGGAARATWRCVMHGPEGTRGLIVRLQSETQIMPTDDHLEYQTMAAVHRAGIPAPEPVFYEANESWLGRPFCIVAEVADCSTSPDDLPAERRGDLGQRFWSILGDIARRSPDEIGVDRFLTGTSRQDCAREQLEAWWDMLSAAEIHPNPIGHAAYRWLARSLPEPAQSLCLVHGDYRVGNFLFSPDGEVRAILDWEMVHIGDPLEDLAWSLDLRQNVDRPGPAGGLLPNRDAIRAWELASGLRVEPRSFRWWQVFSAFKALAIWTLSAQKFQTDPVKRPVLGRIGWLLVERQQRILLDYISPQSERRGYEFVS